MRPGPAGPKTDLNGRVLSIDARRMRGDLLRWLVNDGDASSLIDPNGLQVVSATIQEPIDLSGCRLTYPLNFTRCLLRGNLGLASASIQRLTITENTILYPALGFL